MDYSIEEHLWDHADEVIGFLENNVLNINSLSDMTNFAKSILKSKEKNVNFKFTFDYSNFKSENDARDKLKQIISDLQKITSIKNDTKVIKKRMIRNEEKEQIFENKEDIVIINKEYVKEKWNRTEKELVKYTYEKVYSSHATLENCFVAIHTKGFDDKYSVKPHIHILFSKDKNHFGYGFQGLVKGIKEVCRKYKLVSSIEKLDKGLDKKEEFELKNLDERLSRFSWAVAKNPKYKGNNNSKYSVNFDNMQTKIDRYLELGGCVAFCEKLKIRLFERGINLTINNSISEIFAEKNIENKKDYIAIVKDIASLAKKNKKIPEAYRNYASYINTEKTLNIKDTKLKSAITELFCATIKKTDEISGEDLINIAEIEKIEKEYITIFSKLEKEDFKNEIKYILTKDELNKFLDDKKYKLNDLSEKPENQLLYSNNANSIWRELKNNNEERPLFIRDYIEAKEISREWKNGILKEIFKLKNIDINKFFNEEKISEDKKLEQKKEAEKLKKYIDELDKIEFVDFLATKVKNNVKSIDYLKTIEINTYEEIKAEILIYIYDILERYGYPIENDEKKMVSNLMLINYHIISIFSKVKEEISINEYSDLKRYASSILYSRAEDKAFELIKDKKYISKQDMNNDFSFSYSGICLIEIPKYKIYNSELIKFIPKGLEQYFKDNLYEKVKEIVRLGINNFEKNHDIEDKINKLGIFKCRNERNKKTDEYNEIINKIYSEVPALKRTPLYLIKNPEIKERVETIYDNIVNKYLHYSFNIEDNNYIEPICKYINQNFSDFSKFSEKKSNISVMLEILKIMDIEDYELEEEDFEEILLNQASIDTYSYKSDEIK